MHFSNIVLLAAVAVAAPLEKRAYTTTWVVDTVTLLTTVYVAPTPAASASAVGALQQSSSTTSLVSLKLPPSPSTTTRIPPPPPSPTPKSTIPLTTSTKAVATTVRAAQASGQCSTFDSNQSLDTPPVDCGVSMLDTVNKWRSKYGLPTLSWATNLATAAQYTVNYNQGGVTEVHPGLRDGSFGECITPGFWETGNLATQGLTPFEVGIIGWLCEVPSDAELQPSANDGVDVCSISRNVASIDSSGETGHHDIFTSTSYTQIGCWFEYDVNGDGGWPQFAGQYACDFGW